MVVVGLSDPIIKQSGMRINGSTIRPTDEVQISKRINTVIDRHSARLSLFLPMQNFKGITFILVKYRDKTYLDKNGKDNFYLNNQTEIIII